ncbi:MAG: hypothetical protein H8E26_00475 [FCB group bacterium]|nr:hypothetical protein [FCB group bacterium]MBL7029393.1 hypothetical protein [Candidatus Neomarinimicrobiota bacterium]MBL7123105.1 hypothetical protein [Candidatus Neomarinimicrobiota bacterium]
MPKKKVTYIVALFSLGLLIYLFWGPLFPWSPIKPGFQKIPSSKANVYIQNMTLSDSIVYQIDQILKDEEIFHQLNYKDRVTVIIVDPKTSMKRFAPWLQGSGYSVSLSMLNLIYIGPRARQSSFGIKTYLKHELSHMLMDQNTSFRKALKMHEQGWLLEGVAQHFSGHHFYSRSEFIALCKTNQISFSSLNEQNPLDMSFPNLKLNYTYYQLFVDFLVGEYGLDALQNYIKQYIEEPDSYEQIFVNIYDNDLEMILHAFKTSLNI